MAEEDGLACVRRQSDDLMLVQEDGLDNDMTAGQIEQMTSEEQLTPLAERESDMDEMSNANSGRQTQGRVSKNFTGHQNQRMPTEFSSSKSVKKLSQDFERSNSAELAYSAE